MEFEAALDVADDALFESAGRRLTPVETAILRGAWQRQTYEHIASEAGYSDNYLKLDVGPKLWKLLSDAFGEKVTKPTFPSAVERQWRKHTEPHQIEQQSQPQQVKPQAKLGIEVEGWPIKGVHQDGWMARAEFGESLARALGQAQGQPEAPSASEQEASVNRPDSPPPVPVSDSITHHPLPITDWGEAPDASVFYGRAEELSTLTHWVRGEAAAKGASHGCRLIAILGMGGIGKSSLTVKLAQQVQQQFEFVVWRSLRNAPPLTTLLADIIPVLSGQTDTEATPLRLLHWLRTRRCLLMLDNAETLMQEGAQAGQYQPGYGNYGDLLWILGESAHQSCVILTSREKPAEISMLEEPAGKVRSKLLVGSQDAALSLIEAKGLIGTDAEKQQLCEFYTCSPLALKIVAASIQSVFEGHISSFLAAEAKVFNGLRRLLEQQVQRLSELEVTIMYWLAINREWTAIAELLEDIVPKVSRAALLEALESLTWRGLVERTVLSEGDLKVSYYTQQPVVMEYVTEKLVAEVAEEILEQRLQLFASHGLIKATVKDYIRESQVRLIAQPLLDSLLVRLGSASVLNQHCQAIQGLLKQTPTLSTGYGAGNLINLAICLKFDLSGCDLSGLTIRQAHLRGVSLRHVDFSHTQQINTTFTQAFGSVLAVAFSPDGQSLATADNNGKIYHWTVAGSLLRTFKGHTNWIWSVCFSPDGTCLLSSSEDQTIRLWEAATGQCLQIFKQHSNWVWSVAFSPTGTQFASASNDHTLRLWDASSGRVQHVLKGHSGWVQTIAYSPDGSWLASGGADRSIRLWDTASGAMLAVMVGHQAAVTAVSYHPHQPRLASASDDCAIRIWDIATGQAIARLEGHRDRIHTLGYSPDGLLLASAGEDSTVRLWDTDTGQILRTLQGHNHAITDLAFSPNGAHLITGSEDQTARLWDVQTGQLLKTLQGHTNGIETVAFAPDLCYPLFSWPEYQDSPPFAASSRLLASGSEDGVVRLWDTYSGEVLLLLEGHSNAVRSVAFSPQAPLLASASHDHSIYLWDLATRHCLAVLDDHRERVRSVAFTPNGRFLASSSDDYTIRLWEVATGHCTCVLAGHTNLVMSVAFSSDGQLLASASDDLTVRLWDVASGQSIAVLKGHQNWVWSVAFSPDGQFLASGGDDLVVNIWDVASQTIQKRLEGHQAAITAVNFSPDGTAIVSASNDSTLRVWSVQTGECLRVLRGHSYWVMGAVFSPDGRCIASSSDDETIRLWDAETGQCLRVLQPERPYEGLNITGISGLTAAEISTLKELGAISHSG
ncbi:MAG: NACHT domain-containing protein [Leptolyngbyaceae cyanobacterium SM2_5_2]|nr:NACHT domain-containing protein [Leptolyngbyaceae cyanobacterium SM2_5_2]